jgi:hypothetical protein
MQLNLQLWYGDILVAELNDLVPHQGTWFAHYRQVVAPPGPAERRLCAFIAFCEDWHRRLERGDDPDREEFGPFNDVLESASWCVPCPDGTRLILDGGPVFAEGIVSWNHPESQPSRELAAGQVWSRLAGRQ